MKLRDVGYQRIRSRLRAARAVIARPVAHLDRAVAKSIGDSLPCAARFEREFRTSTRELERAVAGGVRGPDPGGHARLAEARWARHCLAQVAFEPREEAI